MQDKPIGLESVWGRVDSTTSNLTVSIIGGSKWLIAILRHSLNFSNTFTFLPLIFGVVLLVGSGLHSRIEMVTVGSHTSNVDSTLTNSLMSTSWEQSHKDWCRTINAETVGVATGITSNPLHRKKTYDGVLMLGPQWFETTSGEWKRGHTVHGVIHTPETISMSFQKVKLDSVERAVTIAIENIVLGYVPDNKSIG